tara:strand:+ start:20 stop:478 length:459 start_codon:yes stop_codon:yes gene_type:complete
MIKLKQLLNEAKGLLKEFTEYNFSPVKMYNREMKNAQKVVSTLKKAGFSKLNLMKAKRQLNSLDMNKSDGVMFVHVQYHVVEGKDGKKYFIHQTQYWHRDFGTGGVNLTAVYLTERPNYPDDKGEKEIGRAVVLTDDLLDGFRKVDVLKRSS